MDSTLDDGGDFKKARGFLLTYSLVVLALWFFGANLTAFKLMGTEIRLEHRTNSVWLVLACLNAYFWFRFVQHIPTGGLRFDKQMNHLYDKALARSAVWMKHREIRNEVERSRVENHGPSEKAKLIRGYAHLTCYDRMKKDQNEQPESDIELHEYSRENRTEMKVSGYYHFTNSGNWARSGNYVRLGEYRPNKYLTWTVKTYVLVKGAFIRPWFTDHIAPLLIGGSSTSLALWKWYDINFFTV